MKTCINLSFILLVLLPGMNTLFAQTLPVNLVFSEEEHTLKFSKADALGLYDLSVIEDVNLEFYDPSFWDLMHQNFGTDYYAVAKLTYGDVEYDSVGVQFKGQTSYKTPLKLGKDKFSFGVKMDLHREEQELDGYSTLNFNNAFGDATYMKEILYAKLAGKHIPSVQGNYIHLYLNGDDWGIYPNIQQVNNDFLKEWFLTNDGARWRADAPPTTKKDVAETSPNWGDGTAALNFHGEDTTLYQDYYTLKSSDIDNPWDHLVKVCDILNNTVIADLKDSLQNYMYLDATLWFLATEILFSDDDSYVHKGKMDYALYWDIETGLMTPLEIDGNSALGIRNATWDLLYNADNENYPLLHRLMQVPEIRQRYLAHAKTIIEESFNDSTSDESISELFDLIREPVQLDPKRITIFPRFLSEVDTLRKFFTLRKDIIMTHPEMQFASAEISDISMSVDGVEWIDPKPGEEVLISVSPSHSSGIREANIYISSQLYGNFEKKAMEANGQNYTFQIDSLTAGKFFRYSFEIVADNDQGSTTYFPAGAEHEVYYFNVNIPILEDPDIVINEIMATNSTTIFDENGDSDDWIELFNRSATEVRLDDYYLSDDIGNLYKWQFPENTYISPNDYLLIWADSDDPFTDLHSNFKLSASGEQIFLTTGAGEISDSLTFGTQNTDIGLGRYPNGTGDFARLIPTPGSENLEMTGLSLAEESSDILIYPNPTNDRFYIENGNREIGSITIYDIVGNMILNTRSQTEVNVSFLEAGIYIVTIEKEKFILVKN